MNIDSPKEETMHRMKQFATALVVVAAVLVIAAPAMATADSKTPTGTRIGLYRPPTTFPANTPFYVEHGFSCAVGPQGDRGCPLGTGMFSLYVDGVLQPSVKIVGSDPGSVVGDVWLTNFPNGLPAGDHTFVGVWTVDGVVGQTLTATITFN